MHKTYPWLPVIRYFDMLRKCSQHIIMKYQPESIQFIFAGESRTKLDRTNIDPTYKNHRKPIKDDVFYFSKKAILAVLRNSGFDILSYNGVEADDVIASLVSTFPNRHRIVIFSNDRDMRQLLHFDRAIIYQNPGMLYDKESFEKEYGISPTYYSFYKALVGDKSDNIDGTMGWGPVKAKNHILLLDWQGLLREEGKEDEYKKALDLVNLRYDLQLNTVGKPFKISNIETLKLKLRKLYSEKGVNDILLAIKRFEEVLKL